MKKFLMLLVSIIPFLEVVSASNYYFDIEDSNSEIIVSVKLKGSDEIYTDYLGTVRVKTVPRIDYLGNSFVYGVENQGQKKFLKPEVSVPTQIIFIDTEEAFGQGVFYPTFENMEEISELSFPERGPVIPVKKEEAAAEIYIDESDAIIHEISPELFDELDSLLQEETSVPVDYISDQRDSLNSVGFGDIEAPQDLSSEDLVNALTKNKNFYSTPKNADFSLLHSIESGEAKKSQDSLAKKYALILSFLFFFLAFVVFVSGVMVYFFHKKEKEVHLWPLVRVPFVSFVLLGFIFLFLGKSILMYFGV